MPVRIRESIGVPFTDTRSAYVRVSSDPRSIPADGVSKALITAFATLPDGSPVYDGTTIFFTTNAGTLSSYQATTTGGEAVVQLTSDSIPQTATVTARTGDSSGSTRVDFYSVDVAWIEMRASRSEARDEDIVITAIVYGANGARVGDGVLVRFTARSYVNLSPIETSTVDGYATTVLSCGAMALDRRYIGVVATAQGVTSDELVVRMTCTGSASNPTRTPTTIPTASPTHTPTGAPSATPTRTPTATKTPEPTSTPTP